jgi:hypothetical protein
MCSRLMTANYITYYIKVNPFVSGNRSQQIRREITFQRTYLLAYRPRDPTGWRIERKRRKREKNLPALEMSRAI